MTRLTNNEDYLFDEDTEYKIHKIARQITQNKSMEDEKEFRQLVNLLIRKLIFEEKKRFS